MNKEWIRTTLRQVEPYEVPVISESTVINANESPYSIFDFPAVKSDFLQRLERLPSYRYPKPYADDLRKALGEYVGCTPEEILVGNGGDEIIGLVCSTFLEPGDTILTHWPTFDIYGIDASMTGAREERVPDKDGFVRSAEAYGQAVKEKKPKVTVICNPNNPTGHLWSTDEVESIVAASDRPVLVDEAYLEFSGLESSIPLIRRYDNLIVLRTLSKAFGLAGYRIGYAVGQKEMIDALALTKATYNVNAVSQTAGLVAMAHRDEILGFTIPRIVRTRDILARELKEIDGIRVYPSAANFILCRVPDGAAAVKALSAADIAVRSYKASALRDCLRLTATTKDTAERIVAALRKEFSHA